jgi:O-antigen ligase
MTVATWDTPGASRSRAGAASYTDGLQLPRLLYYLGAATLGLLTLRPFAGLTLSDLFFLSSFALAIASQLLSRRSTGLVEQRMVLGGLIYAAGALMSAFGGEDSLASLNVVVRLLFLVIGWFWLSTVLLRTPDQVRLALTLWVLSAGAGGIAALVQLTAGDVIPGSSPVWSRMTGFTNHPVDLGGVTAVALIGGLALLVSPSGPRMRLLAVAATAACVLGVLLSGAVSALLAAALAFMAIILLHLRGNRRTTVIACMVLVSMAMLFLQSQFETSATPGSRIRTTTSEEGSLSSRVDIIEQAASRIVSNPILGVGPIPGGTPIDGADGPQVHNPWLATWFEAGIFGLAGFSVIVMGAISIGVRATRSSDSTARALALGLAWAFATYLIFGLAQPTLYVRYGWIPVALLAALWAQTRREAGDEDTHPHEPSSKPLFRRRRNRSRVRHHVNNIGANS